LRVSGGEDFASDAARVSNDFSGSAHSVAQIGSVVGTVMFGLPPVTYGDETPHQVPAGDRWFVDREEHQARLPTPGLDAEGVRVMLVTGLRGVGKSALIRQWVDTAEARFTGGELYIDFASLRSRLGPGAAVGGGIAVGLRGLGVPESLIPTELEDLANLFRTRTARRPLLVVLDDVTEPAQVLPLIPRAPGSAVVVTSDRRLTALVSGAGAEVIVVGPLDAVHGRELMLAIGGQSVAEADPGDVASLVGLCGGLPVVLRVAAARLRTDALLSVADLVADLTDDVDALTPGGEESVTSVFTLAYQALPASSARLYRAFGELSLTRELAAVMLDVPVRVGGEALSALVAANLVAANLVAANLVEEQSGRRYRLHALVARHAIDQAEESSAEVAEALRRLLQHYLQYGHAADEVIMGQRLRYGDLAAVPPGADGPLRGATKADALDWFSAEHDNLVRLLRAAVGEGWNGLVWPLAEAMSALYFNRRRPHDMIEVCRLGAVAARAEGRRDVEARLRSLASRGYLDLGHAEAARGELDAALGLVAESEDLRLRASIWEFRGRYFDQVGDAESAQEAYKRSLGDDLAAGEPRGAALARYFLARSLQAQGRYAEARTLAERAVEQFSNGAEFDRDERMAARAQVTLGTVLFNLGERASASSLVSSAVEALDGLGAWHYEVEGLEILATMVAEAGLPDLARTCLLRAIGLLEASGDNDGVDRNRRRLEALG
jgi:tetratricopeptide (TPR) repeat protein